MYKKMTEFSFSFLVENWGHLREQIVIFQNHFIFNIILYTILDFKIIAVSNPKDDFPFLANESGPN